MVPTMTIIFTILFRNPLTRPLMPPVLQFISEQQLIYNKGYNPPLKSLKYPPNSNIIIQGWQISKSRNLTLRRISSLNEELYILYFAFYERTVLLGMYYCSSWSCCCPCWIYLVIMGNLCSCTYEDIDAGWVF